MLWGGCMAFLVFFSSCCVFGGKLCLVSSHGNGTGGMTYSGGYIPNPWNYGRGGYEPTPRSNPFSMKTADILLATWRRLAEKLN